MSLRTTGRALRGAGALGMVLLQLVAGAALPAADAALDAERAALPLHIESPHSETCPSSHDHLFCQVVRSLTAVSSDTGLGTLLDLSPPRADETVRVGHVLEDTRPSLLGPAAPRPPPLS